MRGPPLFGADVPRQVDDAILGKVEARLSAGFSRSDAQKTHELLLLQAFRPCRGAQCDSKANTACYFVARSQRPVNFSFTNQWADSFLASGVNLEAKGMNVIVFASRKGGSGKSTLAAHLAAQIKATKSCLLVDADPQGSLTLWHKLRGTNEPPIKTAVNSVSGIVAAAKRDGIEWVLVDTPPNLSAVVDDAIKNATMVIIPARPGVFDVNAVQETIQMCRAARKPYAVVLNGAPARRDDAESPIVTIAREALAKFRAPVWGGQITNRADLLMALGHGEGAREYYAEGRAAQEIARLWAAIERSVKAIRGTASASGAMHKQAA
jgi:cellulose biosynthesis protein BcsQ